MLTLGPASQARLMAEASSAAQEGHERVEVLQAALATAQAAAKDAQDAARHERAAAAEARAAVAARHDELEAALATAQAEASASTRAAEEAVEAAEAAQVRSQPWSGSWRLRHGPYPARARHRLLLGWLRARVAVRRTLGTLLWS
jgi:hypothetical protein